MPAVRAVGFAPNPTSTNMFVQESLVTSLWRLKVYGAAERRAIFHEIDTSEPRRELPPLPNHVPRGKTDTASAINKTNQDSWWFSTKRMEGKRRNSENISVLSAGVYSTPQLGS
jgi:hypothetical protein